MSNVRQITDITREGTSSVDSKRTLRGLLWLLLTLLGIVGFITMQELPSVIADTVPVEARQSAATPFQTPDTTSCRLPWPNGTDLDSLQLAYNTQADEYLAVGVKHHDLYWNPGEWTATDWENQWLMAFRLSPHGVAISVPIQAISSTMMTQLPVAAYSSQSNRYLLAWGSGVVGNKDEVTSTNIEARSLPADLSRGERQVLSAADGYWPTLAHNGDDDEFLAAWYDAAGFPLQFPPPVGTATSTPSPTPIPTGAPTPEPSPLVKGIYAQRLRGDGTLVEGVSLLPLAALDLAPQDVRGLRLVYNRHAHEYLLVWAQGGPYPGLYSRRVSRAGAPLGDSVRLTTPSATPYYPMLAYNDVDHQYLLVWSDADGGAARYSDVVGLLLTEEGTAQGTAFPIRATDKYERPTGVVYNPVRHEYLVAWDTYEGRLRVTDAEAKTTLQRVAANGTLVGELLETAGGVFGLAAHPSTGRYLALEQFGFRPKQWDGDPACVPTPTPTNTPGPPLAGMTPTPPPFVMQQQPGSIGGIARAGWGAQQWGVWGSDGGQPYGWFFTKTRQSRLDERFGRVELGAELWVTVHQQVWANFADYGPAFDYLIEHAVLIGPAETATPTPTPTATATSTPTPTATGSAPRASLFLPHLAVNQARP